MRTKLAVVVTVAAVALAACASDAPSIQPSVYGENGHCYYIDDDEEVEYLRDAGLCPVNWAPMLAPAPWRARYVDVYSSEYYVTRYVPTQRRTVYVEKNKTWVKANTKTIQREAASRPQVRQSKASYYSGNGREDRTKSQSRSSSYKGSSSGSKVTVRSGSGSSFKSGRR